MLEAADAATKRHPEKYLHEFILFVRLPGVKNAVLLKMNSFLGTFQ